MEDVLVSREQEGKKEKEEEAHVAEEQERRLRLLMEAESRLEEELERDTRANPVINAPPPLPTTNLNAYALRSGAENSSSDTLRALEEEAQSLRGDARELRTAAVSIMAAVSDNLVRFAQLEKRVKDESRARRRAEDALVLATTEETRPSKDDNDNTRQDLEYAKVHAEELLHQAEEQRRRAEDELAKALTKQQIEERGRQAAEAALAEAEARKEAAEHQLSQEEEEEEEEETPLPEEEFQQESQQQEPWELAKRVMREEREARGRSSVGSEETGGIRRRLLDRATDASTPPPTSVRVRRDDPYAWALAGISRRARPLNVVLVSVVAYVLVQWDWVSPRCVLSGVVCAVCAVFFVLHAMDAIRASELCALPPVE